MGDAPNRGGSILLLDLKPRFTECRNDTTAEAEAQDGSIMAVSFWVADPPQLSLFSIHCTKAPQHTELCDFLLHPRVIGADGPFVLLRALLVDRCGRRQYFLYKAGEPPSLERIPTPDRRDDLRNVTQVGVLGLGHGGHYLRAVLRDEPPSESDGGYQLQIYSSETKSWSTRTLPNPCPGVDRVIPDKVITQGGLLVWVDLSLGLLVCDLPLLLQHPADDPTAGAAAAGAGASFFVPLPETLPGNRYKLKYPIPPAEKVKRHPEADKPSSSARWFRDLACVNGVLKFIEIENPPPEKKEGNIIYRADLIESLKRKAIDGNPEQQLSSFSDAWRAVTWTTKLASLSSTDLFWRQTSGAAHVADIKGEGQRLRDFYSAFPILSSNDEDILYIQSRVEPSHLDGWVAAVDIGNTSLKAITPYCLPEGSYYRPEHPFCACTLSRHLDMTNPGIQVCTQASSSSANHPGETSICADSCKPRVTFEIIPLMAAKLRAQKNLVSKVHPVENNLPQQHKWDAPPAHSSWAHQNNQPPQQGFNFKPDGPRYPSFAPLPTYQPMRPTSKQQLTSSSGFGPHHEPPQQGFNFMKPDGPGYPSYAPLPTYQSLRPTSKQQLTSSSGFGPHEPPQQGFNFMKPDGPGYPSYAPLPTYQPLRPTSKQQLTSSSGFGPHEVPQPPWLNSYHGASYHVYSQQLSDRQQWQQIRPTLKQPIGASWEHPPPAVQRQPKLE